MLLQGKAADAANDIMRAFQNPNELPAPLAQVFIRRRDKVPCRAWSWRNQLLAALHGHADARGFRQWEQVGRHGRLVEQSVARHPHHVAHLDVFDEASVGIAAAGWPTGSVSHLNELALVFGVTASQS
jgi:hypothetical protein